LIVTRLLRLAVMGIGVALASTACSRGADEARLRADLQTRLNQDVKPGLFEVVALRREGSSPLPASESNAERVLVYFNSTLRLTQDYTFGGWDQLAPSSVAYALGATEKGVFGLQPQNKAGDVVRAYGTAIYEKAGDGWKRVAASAPAPENAAAEATTDDEGAGLTSRSKQLIDKLAAMVNLPPPGIPQQQDDIIADELERASENIERRVQRRQRTFTLATGPKDGDYARFGESMIAAVNQLAPNVKLRERTSEGSVENARLLASGEADYAIVQGDVAAAAIAGEGAFAKGGPLENLRAVGGLFPEAVHIVVSSNSPIQDVGQLRGKRVDLGTTSSGSRFDALAVLAAYGVKESELAQSRSDGVTAAIALLKRGQLDALITTAAAPTRALQDLAASTGLRLLPIKGSAVEQLARTRPGLSPLVLPPNTYPKQKEAVATVACSTLLVTTASTPDGEVARVSELVFTRMPQMRAGSAEIVRVSAANELRGVTIPLHPGAAPQPEATTGKP
jgi:TRAP transporter TAXI family solute receptor